MSGDIETYCEDGQWKNKVTGNSRASKADYGNKADAQADGRKMAIARGGEHIIKKRDGKIGEKNTYPRSRDKNPPKG